MMYQVIKTDGKPPNTYTETVLEELENPVLCWWWCCQHGYVKDEVLIDGISIKEVGMYSDEEIKTRVRNFRKAQFYGRIGDQGEVIAEMLEQLMRERDEARKELASVKQEASEAGLAKDLGIT